MAGHRLRPGKKAAGLLWPAVCAVLFLPAPLAAQPISPFFSFNQSPIIQVHGLPAIDNARVLGDAQARYRLVHDLANNYTFRQTADEALLFDGETSRTTFVYARGIGGSWEWGMQIPYVRHAGGSLDAFIEDWHDTFFLPQGGRDAAPRHRLTYSYQRNGVTELLLNEPVSGIGDLRLTLGRQWSSPGAPTRVALRGALSLPSGDSAELRGSGAVDAALWASADRARPWWGFDGSLYGGGGLLWMGDGEVLADQQRRLAAFGSLGAGARLRPWLALKLQLDLHTPLYDHSGLVQVNATAVQLLMGGELQLGRNTRLELMVGEDPTVHASPDVVFHLGLVVE